MQGRPCAGSSSLTRCIRCGEDYSQTGRLGTRLIELMVFAVGLKAVIAWPEHIVRQVSGDRRARSELIIVRLSRPFPSSSQIGSWPAGLAGPRVALRDFWRCGILGCFRSRQPEEATMRGFRLPLRCCLALALSGLIYSGSNAWASPPFKCPAPPGSAPGTTCTCNTIRPGGTWRYNFQTCTCNLVDACGCTCRSCGFAVGIGHPVSSMTSGENFCPWPPLNFPWK